MCDKVYLLGWIVSRDGRNVNCGKAFKYILKVK